MEADMELPIAAATENAGLAVALSEIVCGAPGTLSEIDRFAVCWPEATGLNINEIVQFEPAAINALQLLVRLNSEALGPLNDTEETCSAAFPELLTVTVCAVLDVPCVVAGKDGTAGEKLMAGTTAMPVPVRPTVCGAPGASSITIKFAVR